MHVQIKEDLILIPVHSELSPNSPNDNLPLQLCLVSVCLACSHPHKIRSFVLFNQQTIHYNSGRVGTFGGAYSYSLHLPFVSPHSLIHPSIH